LKPTTAKLYSQNIKLAVDLSFSPQMIKFVARKEIIEYGATSS
jgi:hypothetical protein